MKGKAEGAAARRVIHYVRHSLHTACRRFWPRLPVKDKITPSWKHVTCADCREAKR